ncbi:hypothetical protein COEREDRAFT_91256 [Coemansia reversa NRRL 1564]|uniref:Uncharacterized protein n=1 Tax=Coemansia reversa (strain ATCC 12441 / NRRL 1564) TaxID=763665 RepID=A0A2G5BH99_COERN|nr:hypothetical protein COEREDRAFT_91256 [Coemansia reversa NRRL 1564]|eukprot:PIA18396.1 hypothetical protein COEREDRAFT_91256 [Coemansia reversa NRRL 1564]
MSLNDSAIEPLKLEDSGVDDSQSDHDDFMVSPPPDSTVVDTVREDLSQKGSKQKPGSQKKPRRASRKIVESSDEAQSQETAEADADEPLATTPVTRSQNRSETNIFSAQRSKRIAASATRKPALVTPNKRKDAKKIPSSAPTGRARATSGAQNRRSAKRTAKDIVTAAEQTPSKPPRTRKSAGRQCNSSSTSNAMVVIEPLVKPSSNADTDMESDTSAPAWAVVEPQTKTKAKTTVASTNKQKKSLAVSATDDELPLPPPSPPTQEPPAIAGEAGCTPTKAAPSVKSESTASRWRVGRRFFKYKEAEATTSITRSGRKVRRPQQWWANAQEHLASPHKESAIKYKWGTGDAVVVRDGKRMRLSDIFLEGSSADLYLAEQNIDAKGDAATSGTANDA